IGARAFKDNKTITTIKLPDTLTSIGAEAFSGCTSIKMTENLEINNSVVSVGNSIFSGLNNTHFSMISVPKHWDDNPGGWISGFGGSNYKIRDRKTLIPGSAVKVATTTPTNKIATELTHSGETGQIINEEKFIQYIGDNVFNSFPKGTNFRITNTSSNHKLKKSLTISYDKYWDENGKTVSNVGTFLLDVSFNTRALYVINGTKITGLVSGYKEMSEWNDGNIVIPEEVDTIGTEAFYGNKDIKNVETIATISSIENLAFTSSSINSIDLKGVKKIGDNAFAGCINLANVYNSEDVEEIGELGFQNAGIKTILDLRSIKKLGIGSFAGSTVNFSNLDFLINLEIIPESCFNFSTSMTGTLSLPNAKNIGAWAFSYVEGLKTGDEGLILDKTVTIGEGAFNMTYKDDPSDNEYIKSISVHDKLESEEGEIRVDLFKNHSSWSEGYWDEEDKNVIALDSSVQISMGNWHSAALINGEIYSWGYNADGQLGVGDENNRRTPTRVVDNQEANFINGNIAKIELGYYHSAAIDNNGVLYTWGSNTSDQLGDNSSENKDRAVRVFENSTFKNSGIKEISLFSNHSLAIDKDGAVHAWGSNSRGQLGIGVEGNKNQPILIPSNSEFKNSGITQISSSSRNSSALDKDGTMYTWGDNSFGQLGNGDSGEGKISRVPIKVNNNSGTIDSPWNFSNENLTQISLGSEHSSALDKNGIMYTWGNNDSGQLGDNRENKDKTKPIKVFDNKGFIDDNEWIFSNKNLVQISLGGNHSSALDKDGVMYTWGDDSYGQLGNDNYAVGQYAQNKPIKVRDKPLNPSEDSYTFKNGNVTQISLGVSHSGAVIEEEIYVWGGNKYDQLGTASRFDEPIPIKLNILPTKSMLNTKPCLTTICIINEVSVNKKQYKK
ncbi:MAG: leucine-rich repeat protein, partial [Mycoplasma sp.]